MLKLGLTLFVLMFSQMIWASGGEAGHVPYDFIKLQALNFSVFALALFLLIKFKVAPVIAAQREEYLAKANEAESKLQAAKAKRDDLKEKIFRANHDYETLVNEARTSSQETYEKKVEDAKQQAEDMQSHIKDKIKLLQNNYSQDLKAKLMEESISKFKAEAGEVDENLLLSIQNKFVNKVEVGL